MYTYIYACICMYVYICIYIHIYIPVVVRPCFVWPCVFMHTRFYVFWSSTCVYIYIDICIYTYTRAYICIHVYKYTYSRAFIYTNILPYIGPYSGCLVLLLEKEDQVSDSRLHSKLSTSAAPHATMISGWAEGCNIDTEAERQGDVGATNMGSVRD